MLRLLKIAGIEKNILVVKQKKLNLGIEPYFKILVAIMYLPNL